MYRLFLKRLFDIVLSCIALIICVIPMGIIALLIRKDLGSPVIFRQERIGRNEQPFMLLKFRSMRTAFDADGVHLPDEQRITELGRSIRKLSIDEVPSLINILKGDMSIVGPRPLPTNYLPWFTDEERIRHQVRGGLTGLAQVNGRNTSKWEERFRHDKEYVENLSFALDLKIIIKTIKVVFEHKDIGSRGIDTPPDFHVYRSGLSEKELLKLEDKNNAAFKDSNAKCE